MGTDGRSHDPVDAISRRRFDRQLTAARLEPRHQVIGNRAHHRRLIPKPIFERLGVGNRRLAIAEQGTDLGTVTFGGPPRQVQCIVRGRWNVDLLGDLPHHPPIDLRAAQREPAVLAEEQQQHGEAQPVGTALGRDPVRDRPASVSSVRGGSIPRERSPGDDSVIKTTRG